MKYFLIVAGLLLFAFVASGGGHQFDLPRRPVFAFSYDAAWLD